MGKSRIATAIGGAGGFGITWVLEQVLSPDPWLLWTVGIISALLILFALFSPVITQMLGKIFSEENTKPSLIDGHLATTDLSHVTAGRDVHVRIGDNVLQSKEPASEIGLRLREGIHADKIGQIIINNYGDTKRADFQISNPASELKETFIRFNPREMFNAGSTDSVVASANVTSVTSTLSASSTGFAFKFSKPLEGATIEVNPIGNTPKFTVTDVSSGSITLQFPGGVPDEIGIQFSSKKPDGKS